MSKTLRSEIDRVARALWEGFHHPDRVSPSKIEAIITYVETKLYPAADRINETDTRRRGGQFVVADDQESVAGIVIGDPADEPGVRIKFEFAPLVEELLDVHRHKEPCLLDRLAQFWCESLTHVTSSSRGGRRAAQDCRWNCRNGYDCGGR